MSIKTTIKKFVPRCLGYKLKQINLKKRERKFTGNLYYCPLCEKTYSSFLDGGTDSEVNTKMQIIGAGFRKNTICPGCDSNDRERLLALYFIKNKSLIEGKKILHIAPEPSLSNFLYYLSPNQYQSGVKYHEGFYYPKNVRLMDVTKLPFEDNSFNWVVCNHVFEHLTDDSKAMNEIYRVLKKGGKAILQVPWSPLLNTTFENLSIRTDKEREETFGQFDHVRIYGTDYSDRLTKANFQVEQINYKNLNLDEDEVKLYSINPKEVIFVATKN